MYRIAKQFAFSAAHHLPHLPEGHPCRRPHGHNYIVTVELEAHAVDADSFVMDYGMLRDVVGADLDGVFDHRDLNALVPLPTTAENLAVYFYQRWEGSLDGKLAAVRVSETPKTWAEYRP